LHPREETKKIYFEGEILKEFLVGGNAKHTHFAGGNELLTQGLNTQFPKKNLYVS
jgi:hypothetical protein